MITVKAGKGKKLSIGQNGWTFTHNNVLQRRAIQA